MLFHIMLLGRKPIKMILGIATTILIICGLFCFICLIAFRINVINLGLCTVLYIGLGLCLHLLAYHYDIILLNINPDDVVLTFKD